jgi:hypothetical protein
VFVLEAGEDELEQRRLRMSEAVAHRPAGELREVRIRGPSRPFLPPFAGPPIVYLQGPHLLELVVDDKGSVLFLTARGQTDADAAGPQLGERGEHNRVVQDAAPSVAEWIW